MMDILLGGIGGVIGGFLAVVIVNCIMMKVLKK